MARTPEQIEAILDRVESLLGEYDKADDTFKRKQWHEHFSDKLEPYCARMKILNGDDFDLYKESFDEYSKDFSDIEPDEYVTKLVENIDALLDKLRNAIGEDKVELESGPEGTEVVSHEDTEIKADAPEEEKQVTSDEKAKEEPKLENPVTEVVKEVLNEEPKEKTEEVDEMDEFLKDLEKYPKAK